MISPLQFYKPMITPTCLSIGSYVEEHFLAEGQVMFGTSASGGTWLQLIQ